MCGRETEEPPDYPFSSCQAQRLIQTRSDHIVLSHLRQMHIQESNVLYTTPRLLPSPPRDFASLLTEKIEVTVRELPYAPITSLPCQKPHSDRLCLLILTNGCLCLVGLDSSLKVITPAVHPSLLDHSSLIPNVLLFFFLLLNVFIYLSRSCSVFAAAWALHGCREHRPLRRDVARTYCSAFSCWGAQALGCLGSVVVAHRLSRSKVCGLFLDQELNPCPLPWQAHSCPLYHQGSPVVFFSVKKIHNKNILFS